MSEPSGASNPYVGPRAFEERDRGRFFGRDRELEQLLDLLIARRLVLLYAPSGAGKTSLIQAALIPRLRAEGFVVHQPIRVHADIPTEVASLHPNRYLLATLLALDEELPPEARVAPTELAQHDLDTYLRRRGDPAADEVFIFDQFEELLTSDPSGRAAKEHFLAALGGALESPRRWALFSIREDYLGSLRPFLLRLPTRLDALFRLDLLGPAQAQRAIQEPARAEGVTFPPEAATRLVDDLRQTKVQQPDGSSETVRGEAIEPVQLQVVCFRLWQQLFAGGAAPTSVALDDVARVSDVDTALQDYYADRVSAVAAAKGISERHVRDWVEQQLISEAGLRGQVLRTPLATAGLPNEAILALIDAHLVRAEERRGTTWYELAHDRLVIPVRESNASWNEANLTPFQRQAALWQEQGRPDNLLLRGEALARGERELDAASLSSEERAFLDASRAAYAAEQRAQRQSRRIRWLAWLASLVGIIALGLAGVAFTFYGRAETQNRISDSQRLAFAAQFQKDIDPNVALMLAYEGFALQRDSVTRDALREALAQQVPVNQTLGGHTAAVVSAAYSPDGARIVTASTDKTAIVWDARTGQRRMTLRGSGGPVWSAAFSPDGGKIVTGSRDGTAIIWDAASGAQYAVLRGHKNTIAAVAYSPDGTKIVTASHDSTVIVWDAATGQRSATLEGHQEAVWNLAYSPDGQSIITVSLAGTAIIWNVATGQQRLTLKGDGLLGTDVAYSPDSASFVTAGTGRTAIVWDAATGQQRVSLGKHSGTVFSVAYSPDGTSIITTSIDGTAIIWDAATGEKRAALSGHSSAVWSAVYSPDGTSIVTASSDKMAIIWDATSGEQYLTLGSHSSPVRGVAYSPDGTSLVTASGDKTAIVWDPATDQRRVTLRGHSAALNTAAYSPDGSRCICQANS